MTFSIYYLNFKNNSWRCWPRERSFVSWFPIHQLTEKRFLEITFFSRDKLKDKNKRSDTQNSSYKQECIPVGCVPAAYRPYAGRGVLLPGGVGEFSFPRWGSPSRGEGGSPSGGVLPPRGVGVLLPWEGGFLLWGGSPSRGVLPAGDPPM